MVAALCLKQMGGGLAGEMQWRARGEALPPTYVIRLDCLWRDGIATGETSGGHVDGAQEDTDEEGEQVVHLSELKPGPASTSLSNFLSYHPSRIDEPTRDNSSIGVDEGTAVHETQQAPPTGRSRRSQADFRQFLGPLANGKAY